MRKIFASIIFCTLIGILIADEAQVKSFDNIKNWDDLKVYIIKTKDFFYGPSTGMRFLEDGSITSFGKKEGYWKIDSKENAIIIKFSYMKESKYQSFHLEKQNYGRGIICHIIFYEGKNFKHPEKGYYSEGYYPIGSNCNYTD